MIIVVTHDADITSELISKYHAACAFAEHFDAPWSVEAERTFRLMIRVLEEAQSSAV